MNPGASQLTTNSEALKARIRTIPDFPVPGILFKDITPLLAEPGALAEAVDGLADGVRILAFDQVLAVESRGFVFGAPLAARFDCGFVMVRKPNKLPGDVESFDYTCEYCSGQLEISAGLVTAGKR